MWTRKELKSKAKEALKRNYWKTILMTCIFTALFASGAAASTSGQNAMETTSNAMVEGISGIALLIAALIVLAAVVLVLLVEAMITLPFNVSYSQYCLNALRGNAMMSDAGHGYDVSYRRNVKTMFLQTVYICLWSLLLVIPGIVKAYEYRLTGYIMAENPDMTTKEVLMRSKEMMKGNKMKAFLLDVSFLPWFFLSTLTMGLLSTFYVMPYYALTGAALYEAIKK